MIANDLAETITFGLHPFSARMLRHFMVNGLCKGLSKAKDGEIIFGQPDDKFGGTAHFSIGVRILLGRDIEVKDLIKKSVGGFPAFDLVVVRSRILVVVPLQVVRFTVKREEGFYVVA
jgi:hypothetical protein